jgi:hypothetical protein
MKPFVKSLVALTFASAMLLAPEAYAQFGSGMKGGGMQGGGERRGERNKGCENPDKPAAGKEPGGVPPMGREQLEYQLGTLQVDLHLSPEQATFWQSFAERLLALEADSARQRARRFSASTTATESSVRKLSRAVDTARNRLTALEDIESATRALQQNLQTDQVDLIDMRMSRLLDALLSI